MHKYITISLSNENYARLKLTKNASDTIRELLHKPVDCKKALQYSGSSVVTGIILDEESYTLYKSLCPGIKRSSLINYLIATYLNDNTVSISNGEVYKVAFIRISGNVYNLAKGNINSKMITEAIRRLDKIDERISYKDKSVRITAYLPEDVIRKIDELHKMYRVSKKAIVSYAIMKLLEETRSESIALRS